jgi:serine/threonine protein kinase
MSKAKIIDKKSVDSVLGEKNLLSQLHHSFIVNMIYSFQDHDYLYLVMDLLPGGNLRYHLCIKRRFNEKQNKFLIGCILVGLEYIHSQRILHRDIKPENLVFDNNGYLRITDFGIAKKYVINNKKDTSGTVGYLAPEILCNQNHTYSIDYYAIGIIAYELAYGHRPYIGKTKHEVKQLILTQQAQVDYDELPNGYHDEAADFINQLIQRKPKNRLGRDGISELINHPWLQGFDWEGLKQKNLRAYYIPKEGDNFDKKYCLQSNKLGTETLERYKEITMEPNYNYIFKKFDCERVPDELRIIEPKIKFGETTNNMYNSSNNSTASISRNNKISVYNDNKISKNHNKNMIKKQRNKSLENIFMNRNQNLQNDYKKIIKQLSSININDKENKMRNLNGDNILKDERGFKLTNDYEINENKVIINKPNNDNNILNMKNNNNLDSKKNIIRLIDDRIVPISNRQDSNYNSIGNDNISQNDKIINNINNISNNNISMKYKDKSAIFENQLDISELEKSKLNDNIQINERESLLFNKKFTNLNQYIMNNSKQNKINKAKFMSSSNPNINFVPNDINDFNGNLFKKIIRNKILNKELSRLKQKTGNSSLLSSNSAQNILKKSDLNSSSLKQTKKHFLKKDIFNGTFYQNKSSSTKTFFFQKKSEVPSTNKKFNTNNKRLTSSSSIRSLKKIKNERRNNNFNINGVLSNNAVDAFLNNNLSKKDFLDKKNIDKNLPFINNFSYNKKNFHNFRSNLSFAHNIINNKSLLNANGFLSEKIKDNDIARLKRNINNNIQ